MTSDVLDRFAQEYQAYHALSRGRAQDQLRVLRAFEEHAGVELLAAGADEFRSYLASLIAGGMSPATVRKHRGMIRPFLRWAWQSKLIDAERLMELQDVDAPRGGNGGQPKPYDRKALKKFWHEFDFAYPDPDPEKWVTRWRQGTSRWNRVQPHAKRLQAKAIVALALDGALRRNEIFNLTVDEMHYENAYVVVRGARKNPDAEVARRAVPWTTPEMKEAITNWLDFREEIQPIEITNPWLSLHTERHHRKPLRHRQFEMLLRNIGSGWEFHRMRHTAATEMLRAGQDLEIVQRILGHARIQQTLEYAQLLDGDVMRAASRVESRLSSALRPGGPHGDVNQ